MTGRQNDTIDVAPSETELLTNDFWFDLHEKIAVAMLPAGKRQRICTGPDFLQYVVFRRPEIEDRMFFHIQP